MPLTWNNTPEQEIISKILLLTIAFASDNISNIDIRFLKRALRKYNGKYIRLERNV